MKKQAKKLKKGEKIKIADQTYEIESIEISDIGKQGIRKVRIVGLDKNGMRLTIIRPEDYPFDSE